MVSNSSTTSLLDSLKAIELYKIQILDDVRAVHDHAHPSSHHTFSVITSIIHCHTKLKEPRYYAQAIVYTRRGSLETWKILAESGKSDSTLEAIESLYIKVQEQAGDIMEDLRESDVWNESEAEEADEQ